MHGWGCHQSDQKKEKIILDTDSRLVNVRIAFLANIKRNNIFFSTDSQRPVIQLFIYVYLIGVTHTYGCSVITLVNNIL
jgi:hypothetical protein